MNPEIMSPETLFIKDRTAHFLNQTILSPVNAQKLAPAPEIADTPFAKQEKKEAFTKAVREIRSFTPREVNSTLRSILNGFAGEAGGWNQSAISASLEILPFIRFNKIYPKQISEAYTKAVIEILPSHPEVTADGGLEALIEAGMIFIPHIPNPKTIDREVIPVLEQEVSKRYPSTSKKAYKSLVGKIDDLSNILRTGLIKPIDTTEIANKFRSFSKDLDLWHKHFSPQQFVTLDLLVLEAIRDFGMSALQIREMSGMRVDRINNSITRLKRNGSIPDRKVFEGSLALQVQRLSGRGLTEEQISQFIGQGVTKRMVWWAMQRSRKRSSQQPNKPQE